MPQADRDVNNRPKLLFKFVGCKTNQYENDALKAAFYARGCVSPAEGEQADVVIVNTCTVTREAGRKSRQMLRRARKEHPAALIVAMGCHAELEDLSSLCDLSVGTGGRDQLVDFVEQRRHGRILRPDGVLPRYEELAEVSMPSETRAFLKIQDGCNACCTYCAIRLARGPARSRDQDRIIREALLLEQQGFCEIVLTGTHIATYGRGSGESGSLAGLLRALDRTLAVRIRLGSLDPSALDDNLLQVFSESERICPHVHLSLQSGCDRTLSRMGRPYRSKEYREAVCRLSEIWPSFGLTTDLMVGFPGETEADHAESLAFCNSLPFLDLHIFRYSPRDGTAAACYSDQVPEPVKKRRAEEAEQIATLKRKEGVLSRLGGRRSVLVEQCYGGICTGYSEDYLPVRIIDAENVMPGTVLDVKLTAADHTSALARCFTRR